MGEKRRVEAISRLVFGVKMEEGWSKDETSSSSLEGRTIERLRRREEVELFPARTDPRSGDVHDH
jgi:hypothetical protein